MLKTHSGPSRANRTARPSSGPTRSLRATPRSIRPTPDPRAARPAAASRRILGQQANPYALRRAPGGVMVCRECHGIYEKKRWYHDESVFEDLVDHGRARISTCPACTRIRDRYPEGVLTLRWPGLPAHRDEVLRLLRNAEARARGMNPMERTMRVEAAGAEWQVYTTNNKLAQRMGRELQHAFHGRVEFRWSRRDRLVRVNWERET